MLVFIKIVSNELELWKRWKNKSAAGKNLVSFMDVFTRTLSAQSTLTWKLLALADDILSLYTLWMLCRSARSSDACAIRFIYLCVQSHFSMGEHTQAFQRTLIHIVVILSSIETAWRYAYDDIEYQSVLLQRESESKRASEKGKNSFTVATHRSILICLYGFIGLCMFYT